MKQIMAFGFFLITQISISQNLTCNINANIRANPRSFLIEMQDLRMNQQYDSVISIIQTRIEKDTIIKPYYFHQLACYYALKKNYDEAFKKLYLAINSGVFINDILSDTDIELLYGLAEWNNVKDTITSIYLKNNPNITNEDLSVKLWLMGIEDQRYRTLASNNKNTNLAHLSKERENYQKTDNNLRFIKELVKSKSWPLYSEVGQEAGDAAFLIVQHSGESVLTRKALKLLEVAVKNNEASKENYAMMLDRYLMHKKKKQIYGTQVVSHSVGTDVNGEFVMGDYFIFPIENEKLVNERRKEMGMGTIEDNAKRFKIEYKYNPEYETISCKKLLKLLIEKSKKTIGNT